MADETGAWIGLFSGGKDSSYALYRALERGLAVERLLTVHPKGDSYMYHVPATELAGLAAESIGIPLVDVELAAFEAGTETDSASQGDAEVEPLERALGELDAELDGGIAGLIAGAVESEFQTTRIEGVCDRLGCDLFAPLWRESPRELAEAMLEAGFDIRIVQVAAGGLDEDWLGRRWNEAALTELEALAESHGVHLLGEGGEFETVVLDGPHMDRPIEWSVETEWDGTRGRLVVREASLAGDES